MVEGACRKASLPGRGDSQDVMADVSAEDRNVIFEFRFDDHLEVGRQVAQGRAQMLHEFHGLFRLGDPLSGG